ncbi:NADH pyrophosphatase-like rudimentary NUDIX domain family [Candidatus Thiomargarita nelsonii]|uniref:NAD(+) diphosphatase n=1 Tax=Candidatus Thiomargarita nelsonii TaxID=1003181 RepID=A0A176RT11_9GAMM|nr:NADH pyrophosphatase-like rudimentary NUDIX domain family [Candidatus Thiomargarita nelsonii]
MLPQNFFPAVTPATDLPTPACWFVFCQDKLLVCDTNTRIPVWTHLAQSGLLPIRQHYLGCLDKFPCYSVSVAAPAQTPTGMTFQSLRALISDLSDELFALAGLALQVINWDRNHQFCGRCGATMKLSEHQRAKHCQACGLVNYPRITPAMIVLITRGQELLLSRARHGKKYSVQAGFVEVGETLEETVKREIREELAIDVKNIRYFGSQAWPFPNSLMIAFTAEYAGGKIKVNQAELDEAGWYQADNLPPLPPSKSIARHMIDSFLASLV